MISEIFKKWALGTPPNPGEANELYQQLVGIEKTVSQVNKWMPGGDSNPHFSKVFARETEFEAMPGEMINLRRTTDQSIPNNVITTVDFDSWNGNSRAFETDFGSNRIYVRHKNEIFVAGTVEWQTSAAGRRGVHIETKRTDGTNYYGRTMASVPPETTDIFTMPFLTTVNLNNDEVDAIEITVVQTSGGSLVMSDFSVAIWLVK